MASIAETGRRHTHGLYDYMQHQQHGGGGFHPLTGGGAGNNARRFAYANGGASSDLQTSEESPPTSAGSSVPSGSGFAASSAAAAASSSSSSQFRRRAVSDAASLPRPATRKTSRRESNALNGGSACELRAIVPAAQARANAESHAYFECDQVHVSGSVFRRRDEDALAALRASLPACKQNAMHVKLEDDCPQGGDDVRLCVLKSLGVRGARSVHCTLCDDELPVYDHYPLLDGLLFLAVEPDDRLERERQASVSLDGRELRIRALCALCAQRDWQCASCLQMHTFGRGLIVGTLYEWDVLSAPRCCSPKCRACGGTLTLPPGLLSQLESGAYGLLNERYACTHCAHVDYHLVRRPNQLAAIPF